MCTQTCADRWVRTRTPSTGTSPPTGTPASWSGTPLTGRRRQGRERFLRGDSRPQEAMAPMFTKSAPFYDALYNSVDYGRATAQLHDLIQRQAPHASTLLDVGCGTGRHLQHFRDWYEVEGLDVDGNLLAAARTRCPGVTFHEASMVDFELPRRFDVITCLFSAIGYVQTVENMSKAIATMAEHLNPGGLLLVEP